MKYVVFALLLLALIVIVQNTGVVSVRFLFWNVELSLVLLLLFTLLVGASIGWLLGWIRARRRPSKVAAPEEAWHG